MRKVEKSKVNAPDFFRNTTNHYERNVAHDRFYKERALQHHSIYANTLKDKIC